jgi:hypothetical protein
MKTAAVVKELEAVVAGLGVRVRRERGAFRGGRCRVGGEDVVVLNRSLPPERHLAVLANCLRDLPHDEVYLRPAVRAALEDAWARADAGPEGGEREDADEQ